MLDAEDRAILRHLQADPTLTPAEIAARAGSGVARVARRLERLRETGVIRGQEALIDWAALGYPLQVSLRITLDKTARGAFEDFLGAARAVPEVLEIQTFLGRVDVRLKVVARDLAHYQQVYRSRILGLPHIADIESLMNVAVVKSEERLPL